MHATQTIHAISGLPFAYNLSRSTHAPYVDLSNFPLIYTCSPGTGTTMGGRHLHSDICTTQQPRDQAIAASLTTKTVPAVVSSNNNVDSCCPTITGSHRYTVHGNLSVSCGGSSTNSATDSVGSRSPDFPTPTSSPCPADAHLSPAPIMHATCTTSTVKPPSVFACHFASQPSTDERLSVEAGTADALMVVDDRLATQCASPASQAAAARQRNASEHVRDRLHMVQQHVDHCGGRLHPKPFTIEAILGLERPCSVGLSLDFIVSTDRNAIGNKRKHTGNATNPGNNGAGTNRKLHSSSDNKDILRLSNSGDGEERSSEGRSTKYKRVRTIFTPEQLERLESEFERQQYMVGPERLYLAASLNLTEAQVKVWFQNRRIKWRKQHLELQQAKLAQIRQDHDQEGDEDPEAEDAEEMIAESSEDDVDNDNESENV